MKKTKVISVLCCLVMLFSFSIFAYAQDETQINPSSNIKENLSDNQDEGVAENVETKQDIDELENMGIVLSKPEPIFSIQNVETVSEKVALKNAGEEFPQWEEDSKEVIIEYQQITNPNFRDFSEEVLAKNEALRKEGYMNNLPVYIVTYRGMSYEGNVPDSYKGEVPIHHEYNVVVDVLTGEPLMGFSYR
ncbi:hypothetical protein QWJ34_26320 [Saccharibacillus sp. CPCC 101409]|uniref:hypothetical protein n=1 Tax=Saccharibacillus sp. CPCC 101409 TaxID=3058041 RepID=UPI002673D464|nr:hypothetical protein [Saccharibacillus sp. CPCC 101409]MDO3413295.1 hypothetical protein [Saccharibacillus sp. CPCC 101409]